MQSSSKCLIIVGMHRSGTSFTTSLLQKAGLDIGDKLLRASVGNDLGHFENEDFLTFHKQVLTQQHLNADGWSLNTVQSLNPTQKKELESIIKKNESAYWGWKDPRTTLFLNVYKELLPNAVFLFVYRKPWEVIDSLFRRSTDIELVNQPISTYNSWQFYNQQILDFVKQNPQRSILIDIEDAMQQSEKLFELLNTSFEFRLNAHTANIFNSKEFNNNKNQKQHFFCEEVFPDSIQLYKELQSYSSIRPLQEYTPSGGTAAMLIDWWKDSAELAGTRKQLKSKGISFTTLPATLQQLTIDNESLQAELNWITHSKWWKIRNMLKKFLN
ncbi:MAG: sulfotransferase family protein [Cytophaga sp.]|uniref:sulfotransferase family protein n=1 Tax=Cytophaga sp. TaxID=29535 RepID=UPI003F8153EE